MRSIIYVTALGALLATTASAKGFEGTWQGCIRMPIEHFCRPYVFMISRGEQSSPEVRVSIDKDWGTFWKAATVSLAGRKIKFAVPSIGSTYNGDLSADGDAMQGVWTIRKQPFALRMVRATQTTQWRETPHKTLFVTVRKNVRLEVLDWGGAGRPIVMLPGGGLSAHLFSQFVPNLTPHYHVYGITPPGFGASSVPSLPKLTFTAVGSNTYQLKPIRNDPYGADQIGEDILQVLNALHIGRPVLVGHSIAGEYLTAVASLQPDRIAGLIYLDAFYGYAFSDGKDYDTLFTDQHPMRITLAPGKKPRMDPVEALLLGMHEYRKFPAVPALVFFALHHEVPPNLTGAARAIYQRRIERYHRIQKLLPEVQFVRLPHADHMIWESNRAQVVHDMIAFISKLPELARPRPAEASRPQPGTTALGIADR